jgi:methyl halide transferase
MTDLSASAWEARYQSKDTPWDLQGVTPELTRLCEEKLVPLKGARVLVPGGGRGYDAVHLAKLGAEVEVVDFSPTALKATQELAFAEKAVVYTYKRDFFELPDTSYHQEHYDWIWEYTFFCAIDPALRPNYVKAVARLLKPKGLVAGLFFPTSIDREGPPFTVEKKEIETLFSSQFEVSLETPKRSVGARQGREFLGFLRKK